MGNAFADTRVIEEVSERVNYLVQERVVKIPANYKIQKDHIVHEMHKASLEGYKGLYIKDYPETNEKQVNIQAIHNVTSKEVEHQLVEEIKHEVDPIIDEKTASLNKIGRKATKAAVHMVIKTAVGKAVKAVQTQLEQDTGC